MLLQPTACFSGRFFFYQLADSHQFKQVRATQTCTNEAVTADKSRVVSLYVPGMELEYEASSR